MNIKRHTTLACSSVVLLMMCGTGYGITTHDDHPEASGAVIADNRQLGSISERSGSSGVLLKIASDNATLSAAEKPLPNAERRANITSEIPKNSLLTGSSELDVDTERGVLEDTRPLTATVTTVSKWLEARANEHNANEAHTGDCSHEQVEFIQDDGMVLGGGWCDLCGCWMRHGCDTNGNCSIGHEEVCGSGNCSLHPYNSCRNSG